MRHRPLWIASIVLACAVPGAPWCRAQAPAPKAEEEAPAGNEPNALIVEARRAAEKHPTPIPEVKLGPVLPTTTVKRGTVGFNVTMVDASVLPREKSPELDFENQTAEFSRGEKITGNSSGATAVIVDQIDYGLYGTLTLAKLSGTFREGEKIADTKGGSATVKGKLREGIWVLDCAFKPVRVQTVEVKEKDGKLHRRQVYYLYYRVINRTGKPRMLVPSFSLVTDSGKLHKDKPLPEAVPVIRNREDPTTPLLGAVDIIGYIPPSTKRDLDDAVFGVAFWEIDADIAKADAFKIYVRGLSDSLQEVTPPGAKQPVTRYKTLRIDFARFGDDREVNEKAIHLLDPPYEWIYW